MRGCLSYPKIVRSADPAAGVEVSLTVPSSELWELMACSVTLVTTGAGTLRAPSLVVDDGTTIGFQSPGGLGHMPSVTGVTAWVAGGGASPFDGRATVDSLAGTGSLPSSGVLLLPGWRVRTVTASLDAGDDYGRMSFYVIATKPHTLGQVHPDLISAFAESLGIEPSPRHSGRAMAGMN